MPRTKRVDLKEAVERIQAALEGLYEHRSAGVQEFEQHWHTHLTNVAYIFTHGDLCHYYLFLDIISLQVHTTYRLDYAFAIRCMYWAYYTQPNGYAEVPEGVRERLLPEPPAEAQRCECPVKIHSAFLLDLKKSNGEEREMLKHLEECGGLMVSEKSLGESELIVGELRGMMSRGREERAEEATRRIQALFREEEGRELKGELKADVDRVRKAEREFWSNGAHPYVIKDFANQLQSRIKK